jgi:hypothetical protein
MDGAGLMFSWFVRYAITTGVGIRGLALRISCVNG